MKSALDQKMCVLGSGGFFPSRTQKRLLIVKEVSQLYGRSVKQTNTYRMATRIPGSFKV